MNHKFVIEENVDIDYNRVRYKYPDICETMDKMKPRDSFKFPAECYKDVSSCVNYFHRKGSRFYVRKLDNYNYRVWKKS